MLTLGELLAATRRRAGALDPVPLPDGLRERLAAAAAAEGETPEGWARMAVADFSLDAGPDEWTTLMTRLRDRPDPGSACLEAMIEWSLAARAAAPTS